jgi:hypothetical protein
MKHWSREERDESEALLLEVVKRETTQAERVDLMETLMADAMQARRAWAADMERECRRDGYARQIKNYLKRTRVIFVHRNAVVTKPRVVGVTRYGEAGGKYAVQALYETMTFDEIREKRRAYLAQRQAYDENVALCDKYLALADLVPDVVTPTEAAHVLGVDIDAYLSDARAAS